MGNQPSKKSKKGGKDKDRDGNGSLAVSDENLATISLADSSTLQGSLSKASTQSGRSTGDYSTVNGTDAEEDGNQSYNNGAGPSIAVSPPTDEHDSTNTPHVIIGNGSHFPT